MFWRLGAEGRLGSFPKRSHCHGGHTGSAETAVRAPCGGRSASDISLGERVSVDATYQLIMIKTRLGTHWDILIGTEVRRPSAGNRVMSHSLLQLILEVLQVVTSVDRTSVSGTSPRMLKSGDLEAREDTFLTSYAADFDDPGCSRTGADSAAEAGRLGQTVFPNKVLTPHWLITCKVDII